MADQPLNQPAEIPSELDRWNWGAFFLNWIWGIGNSTFIALLALVPFVNIVMIFVLGARGSRWAWRNRYWRDAEHFRKTQRNWAIAGLIIWVLFFGAAAGMIGGLPYIMKSNEAYEMTMDSIRSDERVTAAIGADLSDSYWIGGKVSVNADGTGEAKLDIPIEGENGTGSAISHAVRNGGKWDMRLLFVRVNGSDAPIVLVNKDNIPIPNASVGI
jgi:hypothetical protein